MILWDHSRWSSGPCLQPTLEQRFVVDRQVDGEADGRRGKDPQEEPALPVIKGAGRPEDEGSKEKEPEHSLHDGLPVERIHVTPGVLRLSQATRGSATGGSDFAPVLRFLRFQIQIQRDDRPCLVRDRGARSSGRYRVSSCARRAGHANRAPAAEAELVHPPARAASTPGTRTPSERGRTGASKG